MVILYTTPTCSYCDLVKSFFKDHKIKFKEINVAADKKAREKMIALSGAKSVPFMVIGNDHVMGFDELKLKELLKIK